MDIFKLRTFYQVAKLGSLTLASKQTGYSIPNVSRQLTSLEEGLKVKLFNRQGNKLSLTLQGEMLFTKATHILSEIDGVKNLLKDDKEIPAGLLRISTLHSVAASWLTHYLKGFLGEYSDMRLAIIGQDSMDNIFLQNPEVVIGPRIPDHPDLIQIHLITTYWHLYASPAYLEKFGTPTCLEDLDHHQLIVRSEVGNLPHKLVNWVLTAGTDDKAPREPFLRVNAIIAMAQLAKDGLGIVSLPHIMKDLEAYNLVRILPNAEGPTLELTYIYPKSLKSSKRITCLADYLIEQIKKDHKA